MNRIKQCALTAAGCALLLAVNAFSAAAQRTAGGAARTSFGAQAVPAGGYSCLTSSYTYSPVSGPAGPLLILTYSPSVLGTITLTGGNRYRTHHGEGTYSYDAARRRVSFTSGGLKALPAVFEVRNGRARLRIASGTGEPIGEKARRGEHTCTLRGDREFADTAAPSEDGGVSKNDAPAAALNGGARGTLTFRESWGSDSIVDVDAATGAVQARYKGTWAFRHRSGETVFINENGALVIAGKNGAIAATVHVPPKYRRPQDPVLSPDGQKIAYQAEAASYDTVPSTLVTARDGRLLAEFKGFISPDWLPDARLLLAKDVSTVGAQPGIYIIDAGLQRPVRVDPNLDNAAQPAASPDGKQIAFVHHGHLWLMDADGGSLRQLTFSDENEQNPNWSPDGRWLAATDREYGTVLLVSVKDGSILKLRDREKRTMQAQGRVSWR